MNEQPAHAAANALKQGLREQDGLHLESDADEQLLLKVGMVLASRLGPHSMHDVMLVCHSQVHTDL